MEPTEMQEFAKQMGETGEPDERNGKTKEEDRTSFLTNISLAISILAVMVAMVTVLGHRTHTEAVLSQSRAGDQWNEYQAKKIRSDNTRTMIDMLTLQPTNDVSGTQAKVSEYRAHVSRWEQELAEEHEKAADYEKEVARAEGRADRFDLSEAMLQIAVVLSSITLFTRNRRYFYLGLGIGAAGFLFACSALLVH